MTESYKFDCGCELPILNPEVNNHTGFPSLDVDFDKLPLTCEATWHNFHKGNTKGIFQLESKLGVHWAKEVKPDNIEDNAALAALLRPGPLMGKVEGKSMTQLYADRKNGELARVIDGHIQDILADTYQVIVYQEQFMKIAKELAGFTLVQVDKLRKAAGKKDQSAMTEVGIEFLEGCKKVGKVSEEKAQAIWDAIKTSGRYSFNKCLGLDTVVETETELKLISEINIGDYIKAPNNELVEVIDIIDSYQELYEITLESGKTIKCSLEHKFLCENGEVCCLSEILLNNYKIMACSE